MYHKINISTFNNIRIAMVIQLLKNKYHEESLMISEKERTSGDAKNGLK
jgi:hypothetical protein